VGYSVRFRGRGYPAEVGLRPTSLADMKRKLEIHLPPHFDHITMSELTSRARQSSGGARGVQGRARRYVAALASQRP
jgi:hypothetical protein